MIPKDGVPGTNPKDLAGNKKSALGLVPPALAISVAPVMAHGAAKYGPYNWRDLEIQLMTYCEAILRHTYALMDGEWEDPDSGQPHLAHIAAGCGIVLDADACGKLVDNRPPTYHVAAKLLEEQTDES